MKNIYLIDTENVPSSWMSLLNADEEFKIYLFYTENALTIPYESLKLITQHIRSITMVSCKPGNNALDFQLISYLSLLLKKRIKHNYVIVSNDKGYDVVIDFWKERGFTISRMNTNLLGVPTGKVSKAKKSKPNKKNKSAKTIQYIETTFNHYIAATHPNFKVPKELYEFLSNILGAYPELQLQGIHEDFKKRFGNDKGAKHYKVCKNYIKQQY